MSTFRETLHILEMAEINFDGSLKDRVEQITRIRQEIEKEWMEIKKLEEEERLKREELIEKKRIEEELRQKEFEEKKRIEEELKQKKI